MEVVSTNKAPASAGPYSQAIISRDFVFCSGQISLDPNSGELIGKSMEEQTKQTLKNLSKVLEAAGSSLSRITQTSCFLKNIEDFPKFNETYASFFKTNKPARTTVEVSNLPKCALVEISAIAEL